MDFSGLAWVPASLTALGRTSCGGFQFQDEGGDGILRGCGRRTSFCGVSPQLRGNPWWSHKES